MGHFERFETHLRVIELLSILTHSLCLRFTFAWMPRYRDLAILVVITDNRQANGFLMHACGVARMEIESILVFEYYVMHALPTVTCIIF